MLVVEDLATTKVYLVFRGANAGRSGTVTGEESNALDMRSYTGAITNPMHAFASLVSSPESRQDGVSSVWLDLPT